MAKKQTPKKQSPTKQDSYSIKIAPKAISRTRADIASWQSALLSADNIDTPNRSKLMYLYKDIMLDAHLTSQIELRRQSVVSIQQGLYDQNNELSDLSEILSTPWAQEITRQILNAQFWGHSLIELIADDSGVIATLLPRTNIVPNKGLILLSDNDTKGIAYRDVVEYGTWLLEFGSREDYGLLNKAIPHVLFKRFAQSCWSELCEIYGIPPRYIKTDTQDPAMVDRAESMMRDMGSAAWFIIDSTEEFAFATTTSTNGDVYRNLISLCNGELSLLISGAVMGQDTVNGNRSKEESSQKLFDKLIIADKRFVEISWNNTVIPALVKIGILPDGLHLKFDSEEDIEKLFSMTEKLLPYKDIPNEFIKSKFGIECLDKQTITPSNLEANFFA